MIVERSKQIRLYDEAKFAKVNEKNRELLHRYNIDMTLKELSPKTIYNYMNDLSQWMIFIYEYQGNQCVLDLTADDIQEFIFWCKQQGNNTRRLRRRLSSISAFYKYLKKRKLVQENPVEYIERPRKDTDVVAQTYLTEEQVQYMKQVLEQHGDLQLLLYAMLSLDTMARVNAISNIKWEQIDFKTRTINNVLEKEGKVVTLFFSMYTMNLLLKLKEERRINGIDCEYVFITKYRGEYKKVTPVTLYEWCKKIGNMIGIPTLHPHDFRHSGAQILKERGMPIELISELLNHSGLDVTKKHYLIQNKNQIKAERDKYSFI